MPEKTWTKTKPTEPGKYWYLWEIGCKPEYSQIWKDSIGVMRFMVWGEQSSVGLDEFNGWWAPATPPPFDGEE